MSFSFEVASFEVAIPSNIRKNKVLIWSVTNYFKSFCKSYHIHNSEMLP